MKATAMTPATANRRSFVRIKKRAPRTGPSGYNDETDYLERPACTEADAARAGEAEALRQEAGVRGCRAGIGERTAGVRSTGDVAPTAKAIALRAAVAVERAATSAEGFDEDAATGVARQIHAVVEFGDRLAVEDVEDVGDERQTRATAEGDGEAGMQV